jgi:hypothetical protein
VDEVALRTVVIQFDGRIVEVFGVTFDAERNHVALMPAPKIGKQDSRGRTQVSLGHRFIGVDDDELPILLPLLAKITAAVGAAQGDTVDRRG